MVLDNLSTGFTEHLEGARALGDRFALIECDLYEEPERVRDAIDGADAVVHLAANADVRFGWNAPRRDLEQNVLATHHVLEAMRTTGVRRILFSSTGSVYGETDGGPHPGGRAVPGADVAVRCVEGRGRGVHRRVRRGRPRLGERVPVRVDPRSAILPRPRHRLRAPIA